VALRNKSILESSDSAGKTAYLVVCAFHENKISEALQLLEQGCSFWNASTKDLAQHVIRTTRERILNGFRKGYSVLSLQTASKRLALDAEQTKKELKERCWVSASGEDGNQMDTSEGDMFCLSGNNISLDSDQNQKVSQFNNIGLLKDFSEKILLLERNINIDLNEVLARNDSKGKSSKNENEVRGNNQQA